ncbi:efflux RND transporter periplasmic adaptor subunit [Pedobacter sp. HDW13]|uniref:efflux RND transporter periplasmic adaptor subunit n=1 Tax=unclassified Pedobacter TaxID=2628915 RepID=UPI000F590FC6|nr:MULTISPECIES: efflux RND transporter periplasmic adaptor subunit [unclassified Pedobacter]QIL41279.1 efflux RND transporter periplasmic adaptor subunit [Pedobacter sp. HDW13]RQO77132.1 efflux transporter periplasmic adaptor subunit [Pedobacter sp. KBW01]
MKSLHRLFLLFNTVKRFTFVKYAFALAFATIVLASCKSAPQQAATAPPPPVLPVSAINQGSETTFIEYPAAIQGAVDIDVRPQVSGYLQSVLVNEGAYVTAGQTLFKINENPYREALNNAKASLHAAEAAILNAQLEVDKLTPLVQNKVVSDIQLKTAKTAYKIAQANAEQAKANVASAQINLGYTNVKATVSGYIGRIPKKQGSLVSPTDQAALTQLSDIHEVHVYFSLAENDFNSFNTNYPGKTPADRIKHLPAVELVLADNSTYPVKGKIDMIDGQFDKNTGAITLRASFPNANGVLRSGNTGKIRLGLLHNDAILVPQSATVEMQDKVFVFTLGDSSKVKKQAISIVGKAGENYLVKEGVKAGDQIVLSGIDKLQEGMVIQPQKAADKVAVANPKK